jgi:hypothetical protein
MDIWDLLDGAVEDRACRSTRAAGRNGIGAPYRLDPFGRQSMMGRKMDEFAIVPEDVAEVGLA